LILFNDHFSEEKFEKYLDEEMRTAFFAHIKNLPAQIGDSSLYIDSLCRQFKEVLSNFYFDDGFLLHQELSIMDKQNKHFKFDELPEDLKRQISSFIKIQKQYLETFIKKIERPENKIEQTFFKWNASKTDLVELANVLYEGGVILPENKTASKREFIRHFANSFGIKIDSSEKIQILL
jgi:hypothetical protein